MRRRRSRSSRARRNEVVTPSAGFSQDYTQVGTTWFRVDWTQLSGRVTSSGAPGNCASGGALCVDEQFQGETVSGVGGNVQHALYMADPLASNPLVGAPTTLPTTSFAALGSTGTFTLTFQNTAIDKNHIVLIRDSVQASGNRTKAIWCGNPPGQGAAALQDAVDNGCAKGLVLNQRGDSCSPAPSLSDDPWDCVQIENGNKSAIAKGLEDRFACTANNWPNPPDGDQRWAYIILTGYGRTFGAGMGDWLPLEGLLKIYATGWDRQGGGGGPANCAFNDPPPRGYDGAGAQLWGHLVSPVTLDPVVIIGDPACDITLGNIQCKPGLVR